MTRVDRKAPAFAGRMRRPLLGGCTLAALTSFTPPVLAQAATAPPATGSYLGDPTSQINATVTVPAAGRTNIAITQGATNAIVDWTPTGPTSATQVIFQQAGTNAVVTSDGQNYTLLNRINGPANLAAVLNGVTTSYVGSEAGGVRGGAVWFYSPGGIIVGATGAFNVGSLLLTSNRIAVGGSGTDPLLIDAGGTIRFTGADNLDSAVVIQSGAQLDALQQGAYLAVVSPNVAMRGTATVNGSAAYVAGEAVDLTMHGGLFDIAVSPRVDGARANTDVALEHSGTTTGPTPQFGSPAAIYMVAVPKNDAITMLVTGRAGYAGQALDVSFENGVVVLSAGAVNVRTENESGYGNSQVFFDSPANEVKGASIQIAGGLFTSRVTGNATQDVIATGGASAVTGDSNLVFRGDASLQARRAVSLTADAGQRVDAGGEVRLAAIGAPAGLLPLATSVSADAKDGGLLTVQRTATLDATNATGIGATLHIGASNGGVAEFRQTVRGFADVMSDTRASVTGGAADVTANAGQISLSALELSASATANAAGAAATGGTIALTATNGQIAPTDFIPNFVVLNAGANAGPGGTGTGGAINVSVGGAGTVPAGLERRIALGGFAQFSANGSGGGNGGAGKGGTINVAATAGTIAGSSLGVSANGGGGGGAAATGSLDNGGTGGRGDGGAVTLTVDGGTIDLDNLAINVTGFGGSGGSVETGYGVLGRVGGGAGGLGQGGSLLIDVAAGLLDATQISADADGRGGFAAGTVSGTPGTGGAGAGGTAIVRATSSNATINASQLFLAATGRGGDGGFGLNVAGGTGGRADGGTARLLAENGGAVTAGFAQIGSESFGGGFDGAEGQGRTGTLGLGKGGLAEAIFRSLGDGRFDTLQVDADGVEGGPRIGGTANLLVTGGRVGITSALTVSSSSVGFGGGSPASVVAVTAPPPTGRYDAAGGTATLTVGTGSTLTLGGSTVAVVANAISTGDATSSGTAAGGVAVARFDGVTQTIPNGLTVSADGTSGSSNAPGAAYGGTARLELVNGAAITVNGRVNVTANGMTGSGAIAGTAFGGSAGVLVDASSLTANGVLTASASGRGNDSVEADAASNGTGGDVTLTLAAGGTIDAQQLTLAATGRGGDNVSQSSGTPQRGRGGNAQGGAVTLTAPTGRITIGGATRLDAAATAGSSATSGIGGAATGGTITLASGGVGPTGAATSATLALQTLDIVARGDGGRIVDNGYGAGGDGGAGRGGTITATLGTLGTSATSILLDARGVGRDGGSVSSGASGGPYNGGAGGAAIGGRASLLTAGAITPGNLTVAAGATGGRGGDSPQAAVGRGGDADAGNALAEAGTIGGGRIASSTLTLDAGAAGGGVGTTSSGGTNGVATAGDARGGAARLVGGGANGVVNVDTVQINALAQGGGGGSSSGATGAGGSATGGTAQLSGAASFTTPTLTLDARAIAGNGGAGAAGGAATGGAGAIALTGGTLDVTGGFLVQADATGGGGGTTGGAATGGTVTLSTAGAGSRITIAPNATLAAVGQGGTGSTGAGGASAGGTVNVSATNGTINLASGSTLRASGTGVSAGGLAAGSAGSGGAVNVAASAGGLVNFAGALTIDAGGTGGTGGSGGAGRGGAVSLTAADGRIAIGGELTVNADARGGDARSANAGAAQGGAVAITLTGGGAGQPTAINASSLTINTSATGGGAIAAATATINGRNGGAATGGTVTILATGGTLTGGATRINAMGTGGAAFGASGIAVAGGVGTGGAVSITTGAVETGYGAPTTALDFSQLSVDVGGFGGGVVETGYGQPPQGAAGGAGNGGTILIASGGGRIAGGGTTLSAQGLGRAGQASNAAFAGGDGGAGVGGGVTIRSDGGALTTSTLSINVAGGGGAGAAGSGGGAGGGGRGGGATLGGDNGATPTFGSIAILASGTGGSGAAGRTAAGGAGGTAQGGAINLTSTGAGGVLTVPNQISLNVNATGGNGGAGGNSTRGGAGGAGGAGAGGAISIRAANGGRVTLLNTIVAGEGGSSSVGRTFTSNGVGGRGAAGGDGSDFGDAGGVGGAGGVGTGGLFEVVSRSGTVMLGDTTATVFGRGGDSAFGGSGARRPGVPGSPGDPTANPPVPPTAPIPEIPAVRAASGSAGDGFGGTISIRASDVAEQPAGGIAIGDATFTATGQGGAFPEGFSFGGFGGRVEILNDRSVADGGTIAFGGVDIGATGNIQDISGLDILAGRGDVTFANFNAAVAGFSTLRAIDAGVISTPNNFSLTTDGIIQVEHDRATAMASDTVRAGAIFLTSNGAILAQAGSVLRADDRISLRSISSAIEAASLFAPNRIDVIAGGDVTIGTAIADGEVFDDDGDGFGGGIVNIVAGDPGSFDVSASLADASLNDNSATITGRVYGAAGATITAGRDVTVAATGSVESDNLVRIDAGDDIVVASGGRIAGALDPFEDDGDPEFENSVGSSGVILTAGRQSISYDRDPVASIAIDGTLAASGRAISLAAGAVQADANPIAARSLIVTIDNAPVGDAVPSNDGGLLRSGCLQGAVCLGAMQTSRTLLIGGLDGAEGLPTTVRFAGGLHNLQTVVRAYGDITLAGNADYGGSDLLRIESANGAVTIGSGAVLTGGRGGGRFDGLFDILAATNVAGAGATLASDDDVRLYVGGGSLTLGTLTAGGVVSTLAADGGVANAGALVVPGSIAISNLIEVRGGDAILQAGGDVRLGTAAISGALALTAPNRITTGNLRAGGDVTVRGGPLVLADVDAGRDFFASGSTVALGAVIARGINPDTAPPGEAAPESTPAEVGTPGRSGRGDIVVESGGNLTINQGTAAGLIRLTAQTGSILTGALTAVETVDVNAVAGGATVGAIVAGGNVTLTAGAGSLTGATIRAGVAADGAIMAGSTADIVARASAGLTFDRLAAARNVSLAAGRDILVRTDVTGGGLVTATGANVTLNGTALLRVDGATATAGAVTLNGRSVQLRTASATGNLTSRASAGTLDVASDLAIGGGIDLGATGALTARGLRAGLSVIAASDTGTLAVQDVESVGGIVRATAMGAITAGNVRAAGSIFLTGQAAITAGNLTAGTGPLAAGATGGGGGGTDPSVGGIAPGFDDFSLARNDDNFTGAIRLPFAVNYFGRTFTNTFVSNNGYLTFNTGQGTFTPGGLGTGYNGQPIIAAFFADVDTRNQQSALVTYGPGTFAGREAFGATYDRVGYFSTMADKLNSFQIVLTNRADTGTGNFDIYYNYTAIRWETGSASSGVNGFGGISAGVGYNAGTGNQPGTFFELPGSRVPGSFLDGGPAALIRGTNDGIPGQLLFQVRNGQVTAGPVAEPPTVHVTNIAAGNTAAITLGAISAEAAEVHGAGAVRVGDVSVADRGSGIAGSGNRFATVLDATAGLTTGNIASTGYVVLGGAQADIMAGAITTASSATVLAGGTVVLGAVATGRGANDGLFVSNASILTGNGALSGFTYPGILTSTRFGPATFAALTPVRLGGTLTVRGALSVGSLAAAAQTIDLGTLAIDAANRILLDSAASIAATTLTAGGDITLNTDGTLTIDTANAGGVLTGNSAGALIATNAFGARGVTLAGRGTLRADTVRATAGNVTLSGAGVTIGTGTASGSFAATSTAALAATNVSGASGVTLSATGALGVDAATSSGGDVALTGGTLRVGRASGRDVLLTAGALATNEGTHAATAANLTATRNIIASIDGTLALTGAAAGGALRADTTRDLTADALTSVGALTLRSRTNLTLGSASATGTAGTIDLGSGAPAAQSTVYSLAGNTVINGAVAGQQAVIVNGGGNVTVNGSVRSPASVTIASGDDIVVAATGSVGATTQTVSLTAGSLRNGAATQATGAAAIVVNGTIDGGAITLASEAIDIGTAARVGGATTGTLAFVNRGASRTFLGGAGDGALYAISNAEFARTRGNVIRVTAPSVGVDPATPDVVLQTLDLAGSAGTGTTNLVGNNAAFVVQTAGTLRVDGAVSLTSAAATDSLSLSADRRIDVNATTGSLVATNGAALAGRLALASDTIFAGAPQAATDVAAAAATDARDARLGQVDTARPDGYLRANTLEFRFGSGLFVQNSGTSGDLGSTSRAGFAAGTGGVTLIATGTTANPTVIINGRITDANGTVSGSSVIPRLTIRGGQTTQTATLDPRSTANGCLIVGLSCRFDVSGPPPIPVSRPVFVPAQDTINEALEPRPGEGDPTEGGVTRVNAPLIDLPDFLDYGLQPTIDEAVTGAGNDDLLVGDPEDCPPGATDPRCGGSGKAPATP